MKRRPMPSAERLLELIELRDGVLCWRARCAKTLAGWNTQHAGQPIATQIIQGYLVVTIEGKNLTAHRVVWLLTHGKWPSGCIDHINGDPLDNRIENLRDVSRSMNARNMRASTLNTSGCAGVHWCSRKRRWIARVVSDRQRIELGSFRDKDEAILVRRCAQGLFGYTDRHGLPA